MLMTHPQKCGTGVRYSFAKNDEPLQLPNLIEIQKESFEWFLKERCFPATRGNAEALLDTLQLTDYDPLQIVEKTKGRMAEDDMWLKFAYYDREGIPNG